MTVNAKLKSVLALVAVLGIVLTSRLASAQSVVYLSNTNTAGISLVNATANGFGMAFTTGNNVGGYTLDSITILMGTNSIAEAVGGLVRMSLFDMATSGVANSMYGNELNNFVTPAEGYNIFMPDSFPGDTTLLTANTMYIIGINSTGPAYSIDFTSIMPIGTDGWSYEDPFPTYTPDTDWPVFDIIATPVTEVPEPGTLAFVGLGGLVALKIKKATGLISGTSRLRSISLRLK
jgi:hypothetical protein